MSYSGSITLWITPNAPSSPVILRSLLDSGWRPGNGTSGIIVVDQPAHNIPFETVDDAFAAILEMEARSVAWSFPIVWHDVLASVRVRIDRRERKMSFGLSSRTKRLDDIPWCSDHNWYLSRLVPPLQKVGCGVHGLEWIDG